MAISESLSTHSRLAVPFFSTPEHEFAGMISCRTAQLKMGLAAARSLVAAEHLYLNRRESCSTQCVIRGMRVYSEMYEAMMSTEDNHNLSKILKKCASTSPSN